MGTTKAQPSGPNGLSPPPKYHGNLLDDLFGDVKPHTRNKIPLPKKNEVFEWRKEESADRRRKRERRWNAFFSAGGDGEVGKSMMSNIGGSPKKIPPAPTLKHENTIPFDKLLRVFGKQLQILFSSKNSALQESKLQQMREKNFAISQKQREYLQYAEMRIAEKCSYFDGEVFCNLQNPTYFDYEDGHFGRFDD